ncbi:MAG TPA: transcription elongation factor GreA [Gaiellaceae bacterium]|nr:transcription elongation factor GreA [Gaiellaceae bacterium]
MDETAITREGFERLNEELERLTGPGRREIAERFRQAAAGEASTDENADYHAVREEQGLLERRIALLEARLRAARVVDPLPGNGRIDVGERFRLRDVDSGERLELELVGSLEADPSAGRVSVVSPLGKAIHGGRPGEVVEVDAPRGRLRFEILAVEPPVATTAG